MAVIASNVRDRGNEMNDEWVSKGAASWEEGS